MTISFPRSPVSPHDLCATHSSRPRVAGVILHLADSIALCVHALTNRRPSARPVGGPIFAQTSPARGEAMPLVEERDYRDDLTFARCRDSRPFLAPGAAGVGAAAWAPARVGEPFRA